MAKMGRFFDSEFVALELSLESQWDLTPKRLENWLAGGKPALLTAARETDVA